MKSWVRKIQTIIICGSLAYFTWLMILITLQYVPVNYDVSFLQLKDESELTHYQIAFFTHVYTAIFALILGAFQFPATLRKTWPEFHRNIGKAYILIVLLLAAPSGLVMGYYGNGGIYPQISFILQAILWFAFTLMAFRKVKQRNFPSHRNFMILSYAMTLSAISLRIFKYMIVNTIELPPMDTYKIVVWLGWLFNLAVAGLIIGFCRFR